MFRNSEFDIKVYPTKTTEKQIQFEMGWDYSEISRGTDTQRDSHIDKK